MNVELNPPVNTDFTSSVQTLEPGAYPGFSSLSPPEQSTPVQPRNPEVEQRAKAMRGRMWVLTQQSAGGTGAASSEQPALTVRCFLSAQVCSEGADPDRERLRQRPGHRGGGETSSSL